MKVGYGKARVTPPLGTPCALGLEDELVEVFDDLFVRATWIQIGSEVVLIAAADVIGLYPSDCDEFIARIGAEVPVAADRIILHATHTHQTANSRWEVARLLEPHGLAEGFSSPEFKTTLSAGLVEAARQAISSATESEMTYREATVVGIASNRRVPVDEQGNVVFRSSRPSADLRSKPEGQIDPLLRVVLFRAIDSGRLIGLCNYNCHPSAAGGDEGPYATGDFPGVGMAIAEGEIEGLQLLHLTGTCGEINPGKYVTSNSEAPEDRKKDIRLLGRRYAAAILSAVSSAGDWHIPTGLSVKFQRPVELTLQRDMASEAEFEAQLLAEVSTYRRAKQAGAAIHDPLRRTVCWYNVRRNTLNGKLQTRAAALRLGDIYFSFMPGEIFLQFGNFLREHIGQPRLINVPHCLDQNVSYVVPPECFQRGGYEPRATKLAPQAYDELMEAMVTLLKAVGS